MTPPEEPRPSIPEHLPPDPAATFNPTRTFLGMPPAGEPVPESAEGPAKSHGTLSLLRGFGMTGTPEPPPPREEDYKLERIIGRGGFGEVWQAVQVALGRTVAVKRARADRLHVMTRAEASLQSKLFYQEACTSALLDHPNIVPVHDLREDDQGNLLLAMKMARGTPWSRMIREDFQVFQPEDFLARHLPILVDVTQAVAFAHSKGIVHRDLKPGQVMVGDFGEVLLMDWGLAVVWQEDLVPVPASRPVELPARQTASNPAGTPAYMAPEQTEDHCTRIGPWTDVYLLGATLYELLTGGPPHDAPTSQQAFAQALLSRVTPPGKRAPERSHPPELVAAAMKALSERPEDRFPGAAEFLAALRDYLSGTSRRRESTQLLESARERLAQPGQTYADFDEVLSAISRARDLWPGNPEAHRLRDEVLSTAVELALGGGDLGLARAQAGRVENTARRTQLLAEVGASEAAARRREAQRRLALGAVLVLFAGLGVLGLWANGQRLEALRQGALARQRAEEAEHNLAIARVQGNGASNLVDFVLRDLRTALAKEVTTERGLTRPVVDEMTHAIAGRVADPVVRYFKGLDHRGWPRELELKLSDDMLSAGLRLQELGRPHEAEGLTTPSLEIRRRLLSGRDPRVAEALGSHGRILLGLGRHAEASAALRTALDTYRATLGPQAGETLQVESSLAESLLNQNQFDEALRMARDAAVRPANGHEAGQLAESERLGVLGQVLYQMGKYDEALPVLQQALKAAEDAPGDDGSTRGRRLNGLAAVFQDLGRNDEALDCYKQIIELHTRALGPEHPEVGVAEEDMAALLLAMNRYDECLDHAEKAYAILNKTYGDEHALTATALSSRAQALHALKRTDEALPLLRRSNQIMRKVHGNKHWEVAWGLMLIAADLADVGRNNEALPCILEGMDIANEVMEADSARRASMYACLARVQMGLGCWEEALPPCAAAAQMYREIQGPDAFLTNVKEVELAQTLQALGRADEAVAILLHVVQDGERKGGLPETVVAQRRVSLSLALLDAGRGEEALPYVEGALETIRKTTGPESGPTALTLLGAARACALAGIGADAEDYMEASLKTWRKVLRGKLDARMAGRLVPVADTLAELGRPQEALPYVDASLAVLEHTNRPDDPRLGQALVVKARILHDLGREKEAGACSGRATALEQDLRGISPETRLYPPFKSTATKLLDHASDLEKAGDRKAAREAAAEARRQREWAFGPHHPVVDAARAVEASLR